MEVKTLYPVGFTANCYVFENSEYVFVVDPGHFSGELKSIADLKNSKEFIILLTHGHFDHILGAAALKAYTNAKIVIGSLDAVMLKDPSLSLAKMQGLEQTPTEPDITVADGDELTFGSTKIGVMATPGHTKGSVVYIVDDIMFSGDTLFNMSIGRTDFPGGSHAQMLHSLKRLKSITEDYQLLSGHGSRSTLKFERDNNHYLVCI